MGVHELKASEGNKLNMTNKKDIGGLIAIVVLFLAYSFITNPF